MDNETQALMKQMAKATADETVKQILLTIGIDQGNPIEAQKDMAALRELRQLIDDDEFKKDMLHLRRWRKTMDGVENKGIMAAIGMTCVGGIALMLYAFKIKLF